MYFTFKISIMYAFFYIRYCRTPWCSKHSSFFHTCFPNQFCNWFILNYTSFQFYGLLKFLYVSNIRTISLLFWTLCYFAHIEFNFFAFVRSAEFCYCFFGSWRWRWTNIKSMLFISHNNCEMAFWILPSKMLHIFIWYKNFICNNFFFFQNTLRIWVC